MRRANAAAPVWRATDKDVELVLAFCLHVGSGDCAHTVSRPSAASTCPDELSCQPLSDISEEGDGEYSC